MSVRRLAEIQPDSFAFSEANARWAEGVIRRYPEGRQQSAVIPLLMRAQEQEGWVTKPAIEYVGRMLDMPLIRVLEVATFYTQFQLKPVGARAHVQVCGTTPCALRGAGELMDVCRAKIHHEQFHTNADGTLSWEEVECLGACVNAPMVMIFKDTYEDLTPERLAEIIDAFAKGRGDAVQPGPQVDRLSSAPITGLTTLTDERNLLKSGAAAGADKSGGDEPKIPPSKAGKPRTYAAETNHALDTPSSSKSGRDAEEKTSATAPSGDDKAANQTLDDRDAPGRERKAAPRGEAAKAYEAPELPKGEPIGASGKKGSLPRRPSLDAEHRPGAVARPAAPDDLKLISGVGPSIEKTLNELGIYTFAQVAAWNKAQCDWIDGYLNFRGRVGRDDWVRQAEALAKGGEAEYARVFGKEPR